jgi:5-methylcytosine-specific restriction protein A
MYHSGELKDSNGHGPSKIDHFDEHLTLRTLKRVKNQYFAVELSATAIPNSDDTIDDLPGVDYSGLGADKPNRFLTQRSNVKRDPRVRKSVIERAKNGCERSTCNDKRAYPGFLDVHHILGIETSDRVWTCVALCPNCHRESHFSPDYEKINQELLAYALQFKTTATH